VNSPGLVRGETPGAGESDQEPAGFVLAGGRSSRMGADKALVPFAGQPLVVHALSVLRRARLSATIAGARSALAGFAPVVEDAVPDRGPLGGICAAMASTAAQWAIFLPVDLPLLPPSLVVFLVDRARSSGAVVVVPSVDGFAQTFPAAVDRAALPVFEAELNEGRGGCFSAFQAAAAKLGRSMEVVPVEPLYEQGLVSHPDGLVPDRWFLNVNAPGDLRSAEGWLPGPIA
jgi:molybdopterin-guanine dinucleotide biosynthesis protein A